MRLLNEVGQVVYVVEMGGVEVRLTHVETDDVVDVLIEEDVGTTLTFALSQIGFE